MRFVLKKKPQPPTPTARDILDHIEKQQDSSQKHNGTLLNNSEI